MTQSDLFVLLGAPLANTRWSWGSVRADGAVFLRVWEDRTRKHDGASYVQVTHTKKYKNNPNNPGYRERLKQVELVRQGALCYMIMCEAVDVNAIPRQVKKFNNDDVFVGGNIVQIDDDWWIELLHRMPVHQIASEQFVVYFNNCRDRDHVALFGSGAFYDLSTTGVQATKATNLQIGQECVVATTAPEDNVTFSWYSFLREDVMSDDRGIDCRVFFGKFVSSETLSKVAATRDTRYSAFFDVKGNFKRQSVVSGQRPQSWLSAEEADQVKPSDSAEYIPQEVDRRLLIERQIRERRGQTHFRNALRERYGDRCLVSKCEVLEVLEAAHINPYRGEQDNNTENGLLLRSDIHTLFDLDLLGIEPEQLRVELHPSIAGEYARFAGTVLPCPIDRRPSRAALRLRYERFRQRLCNTE